MAKNEKEPTSTPNIFKKNYGGLPTVCYTSSQGHIDPYNPRFVFNSSADLPPKNFYRKSLHSKALIPIASVDQAGFWDREAILRS
jgi:hypothetical protein